MQKPHDDSKACLTAFVQDSTLTVVIEMSLRSWLVAGMVPGVNREPRKKIAPNSEVLLLLLYRWRDEAIKAGKEITRIAVAYETGRDDFWLARWPRARGIDRPGAPPGATRNSSPMTIERARHGAIRCPSAPARLIRR
jgi:transposase